jgi:hypothetical protein
MRKILRSPRLSIYLSAFILCLMVSCKKDIKTDLESPKKEEEIVSGNNPSGGNNLESCVDVLEPDWYIDSVSTQTVLGYQLQGNPYSVAVMRQAHTNLYGNNGNLVANRKYVRFKPANEDQVQVLQEAEPELDLYDYPLDREVIEEGDYYLQPGLTINEYPWLYTVVEIGYTPPSGIQYEVLSELYVPDQDIVLEGQALFITGNPVNENCSGGESLLPEPCEDPNDPSYPCEPGGGGGGGTSVDPKMPTGQISVFDTNENMPVPLRRVRVVARRWFKKELMYTDDNGNFASTKKFRNKVNIFVKFKNNTLFISRLLATPATRTRFVMKRGIGTYSGNLNNIIYVFNQGSTTTQRTYRHWWAAQMMNAYQEFNEMAATEGITQITSLPYSDKLRVVLTRWGFLAGVGATPMNSHRTFSGLNFDDYLKYYFVDPLTSERAIIYNSLLNGVLFRAIDMGLGYSTPTLWSSNRVKDIMYHEMGHASHFNRAGEGFWSDVVVAEVWTLNANGYNSPASPYGLGQDGIISDVISLAESWAEHVAQIFSNIQYGVLNNAFKNKQGNTYSRDFPVNGLGAHLNSIEDFDPINRPNDPFRWIPEGIYYDMFDTRNENIPVFDAVSNYTNQQFTNSLDSDIRSMQQFRVRLLQENGNNQQNQIIQLFLDYGY